MSRSTRSGNDRSSGTRSSENRSASTLTVSKARVVAKSVKTETTNTTRYTWSQIRDFFAGEWVELVDYRWDWKSATPSTAVVRHHAADRTELLDIIRRSGLKPRVRNAAEGETEPVILFVGATISNVTREVSASL